MQSSFSTFMYKAKQRKYWLKFQYAAPALKQNFNLSKQA